MSNHLANRQFQTGDFVEHEAHGIGKVVICSGGACLVDFMSSKSCVPVPLVTVKRVTNLDNMVFS